MSEEDRDIGAVIFCLQGSDFDGFFECAEFCPEIYAYIADFPHEKEDSSRKVFGITTTYAANGENQRFIYGLYEVHEGSVSFGVFVIDALTLIAQCPASIEYYSDRASRESVVMTEMESRKFRVLVSRAITELQYNGESEYRIEW